MTTHAFPFFSRNGTILPMEEATVPLANVEYSYGFGVYETVRIHKEVQIFLREHVERLMHSATLLRLEHPFKMESVETWVRELCEKLENNRFNIKILLIGAKDPPNAQLVILPLQPRFPEKRWYKQGIETITVAFERPLPAAKTLNMLRSYLAQREAAEHGCYEALSLHEDGCIYEGTRSNFFAVRDDMIITPPTGTILEGITKTHVLILAHENGIGVKEERIPATKLAKFDGAFLTSSSAKVMPIRQIDGHAFREIPETTQKLMRLYDTLLASQT